MGTRLYKGLFALCILHRRELSFPNTENVPKTVSCPTFRESDGTRTKKEIKTRLGVWEIHLQTLVFDFILTLGAIVFIIYIIQVSILRPLSDLSGKGAKLAAWKRARSSASSARAARTAWKRGQTRIGCQTCVPLQL